MSSTTQRRIFTAVISTLTVACLAVLTAGSASAAAPPNIPAEKQAAYQEMLKSTANSALTSLSARSAGVADASIAPLSVGVETATVGDTKYNACLGYTNGIEMQFSDGVRVGITIGDVSGASHDYWWNTPTYAENNTMSDALSVYGVGVSWDGIGGWNIFNTTLSYSRTIAQSWHQDNSYNPHYSGFATQYAHSATATFEFPSATCRVSASASHLF